MSAANLKRLFKPGTGAVPPHLAGRKAELVCFQDCIDDLKDRESPSRDLILYGPWGNGKTALLSCLQTRTLQKETSKWDILWITPNETGTLAELTDHRSACPGKVKTILSFRLCLASGRCLLRAWHPVPDVLLQYSGIGEGSAIAG